MENFMKRLETGFAALKITIGIVLALIIMVTIAFGKKVEDVLDVNMWTMIILVELYMWKAIQEFKSKN